MYGDHTATVCDGRTRDWREFTGRVARLAGGVAGQGHAPGERIAILALNSDRYLESLFGLAWGGFVIVPVNTRLAVPEMVFWLNDSGCTGLIVDDAFLPVLAALRAQVPGLRTVIHMAGGAPGTRAYEAVLEAAAPAADAGRHGSDLLAIFYTGGTTGRSKGVMISQANIVSNALNMVAEVPVGADSRYLHAAPMFHMADNAMTFLVTAMGGAHYFVARFDPASVLRLVAAARITDILLVPTMINMVVHHPEAGQHDLSSVRRVLFGASPMPEAVIRRAQQVLPGAQFIQAYGQSEASPVLTLLPHREHGFDGVHPERMKAAGRAVIGGELAILDADDHEVPRGTVGEICARGNMLMVGYWGQPELTAHTLRNGWLHTGDGGMMDDEGYVFVVDRVKDMIVTGGENVYSAEVEEALYNHPAVAECAVIGVPDPQWGERVHAVVRLKPGMVADEAELMAACRVRIANYKVPRSVTLRDEPLPLSGAGKILKTELREPFWEGLARQVS